MWCIIYYLEYLSIFMCYKRSSSYSWAYKEGELDLLLPSAKKSRKMGEFPSLLYPASSFKRASGSSEACSLVMKTNNCLRLRVLTRNACRYPTYTCPHPAYMCPQLAYASSTGVPVLSNVFASNRHTSLSTSPPPLGCAHKKIMRIPSRVQVH